MLVLTALTDPALRDAAHRRVTQGVPRICDQPLPLRCERFEFCPEVTARVARKGERILEIPITYHFRTRAQGKKIGWRDGFEALITLIRYRFGG